MRVSLAKNDKISPTRTGCLKINSFTATVAMNEMVFKHPVRVGDILSFFSKLTRIGRTSITVQVAVYAERFGTQGAYIKVTEASLTYVAIDEAGRPREVPRKTL